MDGSMFGSALRQFFAALFVGGIALGLVVGFAAGNCDGCPVRVEWKR